MGLRTSNIADFLRPRAGVVVCGDKVLTDAFGDLDVDVLFVCEDRVVSCFLFVGAQRLVGEQRPFDSVQRVRATAAVPECDLLDSRPARGELLRSEVHDMARIHHCPGLR